jgi:hypothetical protein
MVNPYYIETAGAGVGSALSGLGDIVGKKREERLAKKQEEEAANLAREQFTLLDQAYRSGDMDTVRSIVTQYPQLGERLQMGLGFEESMRDRQLEDSTKVLQRVMTANSPEQARDALIQHIDMLEGEGRDYSQSMQLLQEVANPETFEEGKITAGEMYAMNDVDGFTAFNKAIGEAPVDGVDVQSSTSLPDGSSLLTMKDGSTRFVSQGGEVIDDPEQRAEAIRQAYEFGVQTRADTAAAEAGARSGVEFINTGLETLARNREAMGVYDEVIEAIDAGADTGYVASRLPAMNNATRQLRNAGRRLGLNVIAGATFGALSEGEMNLAMSTALPENMQEEELREWAMAKKAAQMKLNDQLEQAMIYINQGNTPGDWLEEQARLREIRKTQDYGDLTDAEIEELQRLQSELGIN